jgi:hypothetical protein
MNQICIAATFAPCIVTVVKVTGKKGRKPAGQTFSWFDKPRLVG